MSRFRDCFVVNISMHNHTQILNWWILLNIKNLYIKGKMKYYGQDGGDAPHWSCMDSALCVQSVPFASMEFEKLGNYLCAFADEILRRSELAVHCSWTIRRCHEYSRVWYGCPSLFHLCKARILSIMRKSGRESILNNDPVLAKKFDDDPRVCMLFVNPIGECLWLRIWWLNHVLCLTDNTTIWKKRISCSLPVCHSIIPLQSPSLTVTCISR